MADALVINDMGQTEWLAAKIAGQLTVPSVLLLYGDLGAGKTTLARLIIQELAGAPIEVPSPTFTLMQTYDTPRGEVSHFDFYRLKSADEIEELGWDDAVAQSITIVEWPERLGSAIPRRAKKIHLSFDGVTGQRTAQLEGFDENYKRDRNYE